MLRTRNRKEDGLGLPLPGGPVTVFEHRGDTMLLAGEGGISDLAEGEDVEIMLSPATQVTLEAQTLREDGKSRTVQLTARNARPVPVRFETRIATSLSDHIKSPSAPLKRKDGRSIWTITIPPGSARTMTYKTVNANELPDWTNDNRSPPVNPEAMTDRCATSGCRKRVVVALAGLAMAAAIAVAWFVMPSPLPRTSVDAKGRYRLVDSTGALFDRASLKGKPYLTYFGYTHCPDICPAMLAKLTAARARLGKGAQDLRIVLITIDPERDTPERLASFIAHSGGNVIALTGSPETIDEVASNAAVFVKRMSQPGGGYMIEHTMSVLIYDRHGDFFDTILPSEDSAAIMDKLRGVLAVPVSPAPAKSAVP